MNGNLYFEEHPWDRAVALVRARELGAVHELAIQIVTERGEGQKAFEIWKKRSEDISSQTLVGETLNLGGVISFVGRAGETVVRIFIDESAGEPTENFEIVTEKALFVWKPGTSLQGRITGGYVGSRQKFVCDLEGKA